VSKGWGITNLPSLTASPKCRSRRGQSEVANDLHFSAALAALKGVGAISDEDIAEWTNRMLVALWKEPLEALPEMAGATRMRLISFGGKRPPRPQS
jgi:hypothetical protein